MCKKLRKRRQFEAAHPEAAKIRDTLLWSYMARKMQRNNWDRTQYSCKNYWSRCGRQESGFDERISPRDGTVLATSLQIPKPKQDSKSNNANNGKRKKTAKIEKTKRASKVKPGPNDEDGHGTFFEEYTEAEQWAEYVETEEGEAVAG